MGNATLVLDTVTHMGKSKKTDRKTPRVNVAMPEPWHAVARKLAARAKQPVLFLIISLLEKAATEAEIEDVPSTPWEDDD